MSTEVFPSLIGLGWPVSRQELWRTNVQENSGGKETRTGLWSYPRHLWTLTYDILRVGPSYQELQQLLGFFDNRLGRLESFLYRDEDDNQVAAQGLGTGNGVLAAFQLVRAFGGFVEPIFAPLNVTAVYLDAVPVSGALWSVSSWGAAAPGVLTFLTPPTLGQVVTADFSFYFPARFERDDQTFQKFMAGAYSADGVSFRSIK